jgi:hypothetical protein
MADPEREIVYDIRAARAEVPHGCRVKDNSSEGSNRGAKGIVIGSQGRPIA